jgi:AraC family transcriptional regulator
MEERTGADLKVDRSAPSTRRLIARTKRFLEAAFANPLRLADIAEAVGASPAYLTDVFSRVEGVPLHRYLTQLRLARALVELPDARDLTTLALSLGFSSHSHFTASFRRAFGCTPSQFRKATRN